ncbi:MAG: GatB/YqeY domain-containing protein [Alphaproteobacteria bacterium]|nr:GatB/YqeY domain-containing protein [Alphaproteobacteria bacterium]
MSLREKFTEDLKLAMRAKDETQVGTLRLIIAAMKDKDIAARTAESREGIKDEQILSLLQAMIKQRQESIKMFIQGNRPELADKEQSEIRVIEHYLPKQLSDDEMKNVVQQAIAATGAASIKDMGKVMAELKAKYSGQMDFSKVGGLVKDKLAG